MTHAIRVSSAELLPSKKPHGLATSRQCTH